MEIKVRTEDSLTVKILDLIIIELTAILKPAEGNDILPLYGVSKYGNDNYPLISNPLPIRNNDIFKVIGIFEDPKNFVTTLKLRATGKALIGDTQILPIYGQAIYGQNVYQSI
ncbi:MAG: hypothetical protein IID18_09920 [Nitrospinae bacterium]|nr:hypothetical protein [Nitrospinota bacterium]